jgi:L-aminopeptidase/D-esterase-like protein
MACRAVGAKHGSIFKGAGFTGTGFKGAGGNAKFRVENAGAKYGFLITLQSIAFEATSNNQLNGKKICV